MSKASPELASSRSNASLYFSYGLIAIMMVCVTHVFCQILSFIFSQTSFTYLIAFSIIVSLEATISAHSLILEDAFSPRWLSRRIVEWIVLIVLIKLISYFSSGIDQLAADLLLWDDQFSSFFSLEFIAGLTITAVVWILSSYLANRVLKLFSSQEQLDLELEGISIVDRSTLHRNLINTIFVFGCFMVAGLVTLTIGANGLFEKSIDFDFKYEPVIIFFISGLILISQTQLFIHWARWYINRIPMQPIIWVRWIGLSLLLIISATLIAYLLPTRYTVGVLESLQLIFGYLAYLFTFLQFLLFTPFLMLLNYLSQLFSQPQINIPRPTTPPTPPMAPPGEIISDPLWLELLRSILFWTIFFSVIFFSFRYYFRQNKEMIDSLRNKPYLKWIFTIWDWFKSFFTQAREWTQEAIINIRAQARKTRLQIAVSFPAPTPVLEKLPPRLKVRLTYIIMAEWIGNLGFSRRKDQTPAEFAQLIVNNFPGTANQISSLTSLFITARYSQIEITSIQANTALNSWKSLQKIIKSSLESSRPAS